MSCHFLADHFMKGLGCEKDITMAKILFQHACDHSYGKQLCFAQIEASFYPQKLSFQTSNKDAVSKNGSIRHLPPTCLFFIKGHHVSTWACSTSKVHRASEFCRMKFPTALAYACISAVWLIPHPFFGVSYSGVGLDKDPDKAAHFLSQACEKVSDNIWGQKPAIHHIFWSFSMFLIVCGMHNAYMNVCLGGCAHDSSCVLTRRAYRGCRPRARS